MPDWTNYYTYYSSATRQVMYTRYAHQYIENMLREFALENKPKPKRRKGEQLLFKFYEDSLNE